MITFIFRKRSPNVFSIESIFDGPGALEAYYALCEAEGLPRPNVLVS